VGRRREQVELSQGGAWPCGRDRAGGEDQTRTSEHQGGRKPQLERGVVTKGVHGERTGGTWGLWPKVPRRGGWQSKDIRMTPRGGIRERPNSNEVTTYNSKIRQLSASGEVVVNVVVLNIWGNQGGREKTARGKQKKAKRGLRSKGLGPIHKKSCGEHSYRGEGGEGLAEITPRRRSTQKKIHSYQGE